jgi:hypothetical protein
VKVWSGWSPKLSIGRNTDLTLVRTTAAHDSTQQRTTAHNSTAHNSTDAPLCVLVQRFATLLLHSRPYLALCGVGCLVQTGHGGARVRHCQQSLCCLSRPRPHPSSCSSASGGGGGGGGASS